MSKPNAYFHIGLHKTGTSALQSWLAQNSAALMRHGYLYAQTGRPLATHASLALCLKRNTDPKAADLLYDELRGEINKQSPVSTIISSECFREGIAPASLKAQLDRVGINGKILIYLRPQDEWIQSAYNEIVRDSARRFTGDVYDMREVRNGGLDYSNIVDEWADQFGEGNVIVRIYQKQKLKDDLFTDFLDAVGAPSDPEYTFKPDNWANNRALDLDYLLFLRSCNSLPLLRHEHLELVQTLRQISAADNRREAFASHALLFDSERKQILDSYRLSNRQVAERYLGLTETNLFIEPALADESEDSKKRLLPGHRQHEILNRLPPHLKQLIVARCPRYTEGDQSKGFLPWLRKSEVNRLESVINRQRAELSRLYAVLDKVQKRLPDSVYRRFFS